MKWLGRAKRAKSPAKHYLKNQRLIFHEKHVYK